MCLGEAAIANDCKVQPCAAAVIATHRSSDQPLLVPPDDCAEELRALDPFRTTYETAPSGPQDQ